MNDHTLRSRMKGDFHVRFWNSGGESDLPADCTYVKQILQQNIAIQVHRQWDMQKLVPEI
jgi:hypothetical protein